MAHVLIAFLGRTRKTPAGYEPTRYDFGDGTPVAATFFARALVEHHRTAGDSRRFPHIDRLVLLGTNASMWDAVVEHLDLPEALAAERLALMAEVETGGVRQPTLAALEPAIAERLRVDCRLRLIPYGADRSEQIEILRLIAAEVEERDRVTVDVTHGLRHLPMLGFLGAIFLSTTTGAPIQGICYGAFDLARDGVTPVVWLQDGLLDIVDWVAALRCHDETGDYRWIARLLARDDVQPEICQALEEAGALERNGRVHEATAAIKRLFDVGALDRSMAGVAALFQATLRRRLAWARSTALWEAQAALAKTYLASRDLLRATTLGYEGFISRLCEEERIAKGLTPETVLVKRFREDTKSAEQEKRHRGRERRRWVAFWKLGDIRHALVHGAGTGGPSVQSLDDLRDRTREVEAYLREIGGPD